MQRAESETAHGVCVYNSSDGWSIRKQSHNGPQTEGRRKDFAAKRFDHRTEDLSIIVYKMQQTLMNSHTPCPCKCRSTEVADWL